LKFTAGTVVTQDWANESNHINSSIALRYDGRKAASVTCVCVVKSAMIQRRLATVTVTGNFNSLLRLTP
jgi:hypothetical protein